MPDNYLAESGVQRMGLRELSEQDATSEFLMNALRLNAGFPLSLFEQRTGISPKTIEVQLRDLAERGLLEMENDTVKTTPLGMRFLDTVLSEFLPE